MTTLHTLGGLALGIAIPLVAFAGLATDPLAQLARAAATQAAARASGEGRAEIAISFDSHGRVRSTALVRSTGSKPSDEAARDAAVQLAGLQPAGQVAGRTLVFRASFKAGAGDDLSYAASTPADSMLAGGVG